MIQIRLVTFKETDKNTTNYNDIIEALYDVYYSLESNSGTRLGLSEFEQWYEVVNTYALDTSALSLEPYLGYTEHELYSALDILSTKLQLSRNQQIDAAARIIVQSEAPLKVIQHQGTQNFTIEKDPLIRGQLLMKAFSSLLKVQSLDLACVLSINKIQGTSSAKNRTERFVVPNDVTLENGLVYHHFTSSLGLSSDERILCLYPSPYFIRKWINDPKMVNRSVTFVMREKSLCDLVKSHFADDSNTDAPSGTLVISAEDILNQQSTVNLKYSKVLFFATNVSASDQIEWLQFIKTHSCQHHTEISVLLSSYEFEKAYSPFSSELDDPHLKIVAISLIPQGINNSTRPRRKLFLNCVYAPDVLFDTATLETEVSTYTLNTDLKTQALSVKPDAHVMIHQFDLVDLNKSIRELFRKELLTRHAFGRKKTAPFSFEITPDILGWCSKSYPKNNAARPRLEVYVCSPADSKKRDRGYMDRGVMIHGTRKRVTRFSDNEILSWLEDEYPYTIVQPRSSVKNDDIGPFAELKPIVNIRDEIISEYTPRLKGENIAIKTLWYLYPYLKDYYSGVDYLMLTHMAKHTEIGQIYVDDLTIEQCDEWLPRIYPNESDSSLWHRVEILNLALNKAVELGHCAHNEIAPILISQKQQDKYFRQVRASLVKKHLTEEELLKLYTFLKNKIKNEEKLEYLGVLIRFMTGLESNIVCALKWSDLRYVSDYGFSTLVITRQVSNDGKCYAPFDAIEDYLQFPCSALLQEYLDFCKEQLEKVVSKWSRVEKIPIVKVKEDLANPDTRYNCFAPKALDKLCREAVRSVGINERIITLPTMDNGTKETNLNQYGGNFFRENFRYWTINHCKLINDELAYLIRNKPETTFGRYYCDFLNDASQFVLYKKLFRLDALLSSTPAQAKRIIFNDRYCLSVDFLNNRSTPACVEAVVTRADSSDEINITISSAHGVKTYISILESEEGSLC